MKLNILNNNYRTSINKYINNAKDNTNKTFSGILSNYKDILYDIMNLL